MIETSFTKRSAEDILTSSADLLSEIKGLQSQFTHSSQAVSRYVDKVLSVLVPDEFEWEDIIVNLFNPESLPKSAPVGTTVIIHGHSRGETCFSNKFCHVLGYVPKEGGTKFWKAKWHGIY